MISKFVGAGHSRWPHRNAAVGLMTMARNAAAGQMTSTILLDAAEHRWKELRAVVGRTILVKSAVVVRRYEM